MKPRNEPDARTDIVKQTYKGQENFQLQTLILDRSGCILIISILKRGILEAQSQYLTIGKNITSQNSRVPTLVSNFI